MKFKTAIKWSTLNTVAINVVQLSFSILFVRLLTPTDFGFIAMITVFTAVLSVFVDSGLGAYIIYKNEPDQIDKSTIFWLNIGIGSVIALLLGLVSPLIAEFYSEPILQTITIVFAVNIFLSSFNIVQIALLRKERNFKIIFIARGIAIIFSSLLGLSLALSNYGVWSLVSREVSMSVFFILIIWLIVKWRPSFNFSFNRIKQIATYSVPLLFSNLIGYASKNIDYLILGKTIGSEQLGFYQKGYQFSSLPGNQITEILGNLIFASFSKMKKNNEIIWNSYVDLSKGITFVSMFATLCVFFLANTFVKNIFGDRWLETVGVFQSFFLLILFLPHHRIVGSLFYTLNATKKEMYINILLFPMYFGLIFISQYGLKTSAFYISLLIFFFFLIRTTVAVKLLNQSFSKYIFKLRSYFLDGLIVFIILYLLRFHEVERWFWLFVGPILIFCLLVLIRLIFFKKESLETFRAIKMRLS